MTATMRHVSNKGPVFGILLIWAIAQASAAIAYETCISRGEQRSPAGVWRCGSSGGQSWEQVAVTGKDWVVG